MYPYEYYAILVTDIVNNCQLLISGSKAHKVFQFVKITKIRKRDVAQNLFDQNPYLDLETALTWFYRDKNDDRYREVLKTEDEFYEEEQGKISIF